MTVSIGGKRQHDGINDFVHHVVSRSFEDLPSKAVLATKTFILDCLGVAMTGTLAPGAKEMHRMLRGWGGKEESSVLILGGKLPAPSAAMLNSFLMHNQEFDCANDEAVLHPFTTALPVALAVAEAKGNVTGRDLLTAVALGVDVSCSIGLASRSPMRHFRPGTTGAFGATAAAGKVLGLDENTLVNAMGIVYSQVSGTLQPHHEGATVNSMQTGFNARGAVTAAHLAQAGIDGTEEVLEGRYGYLRLFEGEYDLDEVLTNLGRVWQSERVAHKPWPCGRLTHRSVEGAMMLQDKYHFSPEDILECETTMPPLPYRLVGRPMDRDNPTTQYAKLSIPFVLAVALLKNDVFVGDFIGDALRDPAVHALARRIKAVEDRNPDQNAMGPVTVKIKLRNGSVHEEVVPDALGHPNHPLSREQHLAKFNRCWQAGVGHLPQENRERLINLVDHLEEVGSVEELVEMLVA